MITNAIFDIISQITGELMNRNMRLISKKGGTKMDAPAVELEENEMGKGIKDTIFFRNNLIYCKDNYLYLVSKGNRIKLGEEIKVLSTNKDIDNDEYSLLIEYYFKGKPYKIEIPRHLCLKKSELIKYQRNGLDVTERTAEAIISYLQEKEKTSSEELVHSSIGYSNYCGKDIFKLYKGININSNYIGKLDIEPKGSYEKWIKCVNEYVIGNVPLETMLVVGLSSAIIGIVGNIIELDTMFIHISGDSTSGKTISSMLAISPWGNPNLKIRNGLATTWNSTENAVFSNIISNHGLAVLLDEISMSDSIDFTQAVYRLSGGKDKQRLDKESIKKDTGTWNTTIISNGEFRLLEKAKKNTGAKMRIIDFSNVIWTKDGESADALKEGILHNYGYAGIEFVENLLKQMDAETICTELKSVREEVISKMMNCGVNDRFVSRRSWKYAVLMYTASLAKEILNLSLDTDGIFSFLMEHEKESAEGRNIEDNALEYIMEQVTINFKKFISSDEVEPANDKGINNKAIDTWGKINILENESFNEICIIREVFNKLMKDGGFEDPKMILKSWKEKGILDTEKDRHTRKRKLIQNASQVSVYVLKVDKDKISLDAA